MEVVALIPAHNEADCVGATIESLRAQHRVPDRIIVISDNSIDATEQIAADAGVEVFVTQGNTNKKAGALGQALTPLLLELSDEDAVLVMDADSTLGPKFLSVAAERLQDDSRLGAVGGIFYGEKAQGLLQRMQANEYQRYSWDIHRHAEKVFVLTGTGTLFRVKALREVQDKRGSVLPGIRGDVYHRAAITEDNELTLALKTLKWKLVSPRECSVATELMPTWKMLWRQRLRWKRGAIDDLVRYGFTRVTWKYWLQQAGIFLGTIYLALYLTLIIGLYAVLHTGWQFQPLWIGCFAVVMVERLRGVWAAGWEARLISFASVPELVYDLVQSAIYVQAMWNFLWRKKPAWHHAPIAGVPSLTGEGVF